MSVALHIPRAITAKTTDELSKKLLEVQIKEFGKVKVLTIYFDTEKGEHVLWYYPIRNNGMNVVGL